MVKDFLKKCWFIFTRPSTIISYILLTECFIFVFNTNYKNSWYFVLGILFLAFAEDFASNDVDFHKKHFPDSMKVCGE